MERMYGVTFDNKHSYNDWGIYWNGYSEDSPEPQRVLVEVPYRNGLLDVTNALTDKVFYKSRKVSFDFIVFENSRTWPEVRAMVLGAVHGKSIHVVMDTDPDYYWDAYNCTVSTPNAEEEQLKFTIECECFPYKLKNNITKQRILVAGMNLPLNCKNSRMEVNPTFAVEKEVQVSFVDYTGSTITIAMGPGNHTYDNIEFREGNNILTFSKISDPTYVEVTYQEGKL